MNNFRFYFDCYTKARKKTIIVLCIIGIPLSTLAGSPFLWYAMEYQAESFIWQILVKIVLYILFPTTMVFVAGLIEKNFKMFFQKSKKGGLIILLFFTYYN